MKIGYVRASTIDQSLDLQKDALDRAGCDRIFVDRVSCAVSQRPALEKVKKILRRGDTLVIWRLDRLGCSLRDLIEWVAYLDDHDVGLQSINEAIDTNTPSGNLTFRLFGAIAEFDRDLMREGAQHGLTPARARGRNGGRRKALDSDKRALAVSLYKQKNMSVGKICELMGISKPTLYSYVREHQ